jgi:hypothetical protein
MAFAGFAGSPGGTIFRIQEANVTDYLAMRKRLLSRDADPFAGFAGSPSGTISGERAALVTALAALSSRCPDHVDMADWQQAVVDGRRFLSAWGDQAGSLGWTVDDLFGLHDPPECPASNYRRLSRYDATGLVWLLRGRRVLGMTAASAAVEASGGVLTFYRRINR